VEKLRLLREPVLDAKRALSWQSISIVLPAVDVAILSLNVRKRSDQPDSFRIFFPLVEIVLFIIDGNYYSPTIAIIHLTKIRTPTTAVRSTSIVKIPGIKTSADAAAIKAIGNVTMKGNVAMVNETSSLDTIEFTSVRTQIA
jgi:hypothetical protein